MKYNELIILLPCQSLEDFPQHHVGDEAENLLACWTSLWHPALLVSAGSIPKTHKASDPPAELAGKLLVVPLLCEHELPMEFSERAAHEGACLVSGVRDRDSILSRTLSNLDLGDRAVDRELAMGFLALGYAYLQTQVLTRQMRYSSSLDEGQFGDHALAAAKAAVEGERASAETKLKACFDLLSEERDHYYAVEAYLLDVTLVSESTLGAPLRNELSKEHPINLLLSGQLLARMAEKEPATLEAVRQGVDAGRVAIVGGEELELALPLLSPDSILGELKRGAECYRRWLNHPTTVFGRRRFGMVPDLPLLLSRLGFRGAYHPTFDDGQFPEGSQIKSRWEGAGSSAFDTLAKSPLDANRAETFLRFGAKLGESMDMDHVATLALVHWPGHASRCYEDLKRCARYGTALGRFLTLETYFRDTYTPSHRDRFEPDQYRSPYLRQAVAREKTDPLSASLRYWRRRATLDATGALGVCLSALGWAPPEIPDRLDRLVDHTLEGDESAGIDDEIAQSFDERKQRFGDKIPRKQAAPQAGYLLVNPCSFVRRVGLDLPELSGLPSVGAPIYAAAEDERGKHAVVDIPAMGFVWVSPSKGTAVSSRDSVLLVDDLRSSDGVLLLRNEFLEATVALASGSLRALKDYASRDNRLSQQLALRIPPSRRAGVERRRKPAIYSTMVADSVQIARATPVVGEVVARGRLVSRQGNVMAHFVQTYRVWRGSRVLAIDIELDPKVELGPDPWESYFACRFAWADETAELSRSLQLARHKATAKRMEAPHFLEIASGESRTAILTNGLPYHRRVGIRALDSLLVVRGEQQRRFQLGVGVDLTHPIHQAMEMTAPIAVIPQTAPPTALAPSSWFFHLDARSVVATHWSPIVEERRVVGFRVRLRETAGRAVKAKLSSCRPVVAARLVRFDGETMGDCRLDNDRVNIELSAQEWIEVEARWFT